MSTHTRTCICAWKRSVCTAISVPGSRNGSETQIKRFRVGHCRLFGMIQRPLLCCQGLSLKQYIYVCIYIYTQDLDTVIVHSLHTHAASRWKRTDEATDGRLPRASILRDRGLNRYLLKIHPKFCMVAYNIKHSTNK